MESKHPRYRPTEALGLRSWEKEPETVRETEKRTGDRDRHLMIGLA